VVGGGPAGAATALALGRRDPSLSVVLLEKRRFPRPKLCGGAMPRRAESPLRRLGLDFDAIPVPSLPYLESSIRFGERRIVWPEPRGGKIFERAPFDAWLLDEARRGGAVVRERFDLVDIEGGPGDFLLRPGGTGEGEPSPHPIRARTIVGADGVAGAVRRLRSIGSPLASGRLAQVELPDPRPGDDEGTRPELDFSPLDRGIGGYAWQFPALRSGRPVLEIGIYGRRGTAPRLLREECARRARLAGFPSPPPSAIRCWAIRELSPSAPLSSPGILLVGDAAGSDPLLAEGIRFALEWGLLAADHLCESLERGRNPTLAGFERRVASSRLAREIGRNRLIADLAYGAAGGPLLGAAFHLPAAIPAALLRLAARLRPADP
jgi:flavin-dependent dehydrogenase